MSKMKNFLSEFWDDILVYVLTFMGVLLARVYPYFNSLEPFNPAMVNIPRLCIAATIALMLVLQSEAAVAPPDPKAPLAHKIGKRQAVFRRCSAAISQGFTYATLIN